MKLKWRNYQNMMGWEFKMFRKRISADWGITRQGIDLWNKHDTDVTITCNKDGRISGITRHQEHVIKRRGSK